MPHRTWNSKNNRTRPDITPATMRRRGILGIRSRLAGLGVAWVALPQAGQVSALTGWSQTKQYRTTPAYATAEAN